MLPMILQIMYSTIIIHGIGRDTNDLIDYKNSNIFVRGTRAGF